MRPKVAPVFRPANAPFAPVKPLQPVKFSDDTERLQHINSIRKSTVGAQIKLVIVLLEKPTHVLTGRDQLLSLIIKSKDCIAVEEVKDAYPSVLEDL